MTYTPSLPLLPLFFLSLSEDLADTDATPTATNLGFLASGTSLDATGDQRERLVPRSSGGGGGGTNSGSITPTSNLDMELKDSLPPLPRERLSMRGTRPHRLVNTQSDDNDSAVSMVSRASFGIQCMY